MCLCIALSNHMYTEALLSTYVGEACGVGRVLMVFGFESSISEVVDDIDCTIARDKMRGWTFVMFTQMQADRQAGGQADRQRMRRDYIFF